MAILSIWDWKYRLCLCEEVQNAVLSFMLLLQEDEQEIYSQLVTFYTSFYSLDTLIELLEVKPPEQGVTLLNKALEHKAICLAIPPILTEHYTQLIASKFAPKSVYHTVLMELLDYASREGFTPDMTPIYRVIFGAWHPMILEKIKNPTPVTRTLGAATVPVTEVTTYVHNTLAHIEKEVRVQEQFGRSVVKDFDLMIKEGRGFAEWWDRELAERDKDLLILFDNPDALAIQELDYTLYHEVYPGHGQFYNLIREYVHKGAHFDHGAMSLVEGWATYCEWHTAASPYSHNLRELAKAFLWVSLHDTYNSTTKVDHIYRSRLSHGYSENQAITSIVTYTQYPGFTESYYLGALCIEAMIEQQYFKTPQSFLRALSHNTYGELFALWHKLDKER